MCVLVLTCNEITQVQHICGLRFACALSLLFCLRFCVLSAFEHQLQDPPADSECFAKLRDVVRLVVGGYSDLLGLKV